MESREGQKANTEYNNKLVPTIGNQGLIPYCQLRNSLEYTSELTHLKVVNLMHLYTNCCPFWLRVVPRGIVPHILV